MKSPTMLTKYYLHLYRIAGGIKPLLATLSRPDAIFSGYPSNHCYRLADGNAFPSFQLFERWHKVHQLIPANATSMIDLACCRGYYLIGGMCEAGITRAVGIDVSDHFLEESGKAAEYLGLDIHLSKSDLEYEVARIKDGTAAYDVVVLTGAYHYFYWSENGPNHALKTHDDIFDCLVDLCHDTLIISARLGFDRLTPSLQAIARQSPHLEEYTTDHFLESAKRHFDVSVHGSLAKDALYVMKKRTTNYSIV